jgi:SAM-dependent methyltransferase
MCKGFSAPRVIEIGSYDVNEAAGGIRSIFSAASEYVGVDLAPGPGVDIVCSGHEVDLGSDRFDIAISSECFEHNPHWRETFINMHRMLRPGGLLIMTCATTGRVEHGTARTDPRMSPGTHQRGWSYYRNLTRADFEASLGLEEMFALHRFYTASTSHDLYFVGFKEGGSFACDVAALEAGIARLGRERRRAMPPAKRLARQLARAPLGLVAKLLPEHAFQAVAVPYSRAIYRLSARLGVNI